MIQSFELLSVVKEALVLPSLLDFNDKQDIIRHDLSRCDGIGRMFDHTDFTKAYYYFLLNKNDIIEMTTEKLTPKGSYIYEYDENNNTFMPTLRYKDAIKKANLKSRITQSVKKKKLLAKFGNKDITLADKMFCNPNNIKLKLVSGDKSYYCQYTDEFIKPCYYPSLIINGTNGLELKSIHYSKYFYKSSNQHHKGSIGWLGIPEGFAYVIENRNELEEDNCGKYYLFDKGSKIKTYDNLDALMSDKTLKKYVYTGNEADWIDLDTAQIFFEVES